MRNHHRKTSRMAGLLTVVALGLAACGSNGSTDESSSSGSDARSSSGEQAAASESAAAGESTDPSADNPPVDPGDGGDYQPNLDPADFVDPATDPNPYMPLVPGTTWTYEETNGDGETEQIEVVVTEERRNIQGIQATVVRDTVTLDGVLVEDTFDWFAQDVEGNVWYLGEDVDNYENGQLVDHDGSFEYGVDGALPGIVMPADPRVGDAYRQEFYVGEAEDMAEVLQTDATVSTPAGDFDNVLVTEDWNPLEPDIIEQKYYAPGIGLVAERKVAGETGEGQLLATSLIA